MGNGFVASLAKPGGNITGLSTLSPEISGKQLELLKEIVPKLSRIAVLDFDDSRPCIAVKRGRTCGRSIECAASISGRAGTRRTSRRHFEPQAISVQRLSLCLGAAFSLLSEHAL